MKPMRRRDYLGFTCSGLLLLSGCSGNLFSTRGLIDGGAATGAGYIANKISNGNSIATVAAAGGAGFGADIIQGAIQSQTEKKLEAGYNLGRADATKQLYWATQRAQGTADNGRTQFSEYQIPLPEQTIDGVIYEPTTKTLRISQ
jgi:hypothetical protein